MDHLLSLSYWIEADPGPLTLAGRLSSAALAAGIALGLAWAMASWRRKPVAPALCVAAGLACLAAIAAIALRLGSDRGYPPRIWVGAPLAIALAARAGQAWLAPEWDILRKGWGALWAFRPAPLSLSPRAAALLVALHLAGLPLLLGLAGWPAWPAPGLLVALLVPGFLARLLRAPHTSAPLALNALAPAYLLGSSEVLRRAAGGLGWGIGRWPPIPLWPAVAILAAYACAYQWHNAWPASWRAAAVALGAGTLGWAAWAYLGLRARGVTASDPYCYVQMAVDLAQRGTLLHRFPLASLARRLQIDAGPLLHAGYRLPVDALGRAPTVWPAGHAVLLGLAGMIGGEAGIYLATPLLAVAGAGVVIWLGALLLDDLEPPLRALVASLAGLLVATSYEQLRWVLVHMGDVSAQLFSTLTVALACTGAWRWRRGRILAAGLALGLAYWARHTQLAMALPALALLCTAGAPATQRERWLDGMTYLVAALVAALPDLAYHQAVFGSPLRPESQELALYSAGAVARTTLLLLKGWLAAPELGLLAPFLAIGAAVLWRRNRRASLALGLWLVGLWAVQAPYAALRLRDLLPALPALALLAAYGVGVSLRWLAPRRTAAVALALGLAGLLWLRTAETVVKPLRRDFNNFGYLWPAQRQEFAALQALTEHNAVIGSTLNGGPLDLYAGREAFRPAEWGADDLQRFLRALWAEGRPVYLLADGDAMDAVLATARRFGRLTPVHTLRRIPYYAPNAGSEPRDVTLYRVEP